MVSRRVYRVYDVILDEGVARAARHRVEVARGDGKIIGFKFTCTRQSYNSAINSSAEIGATFIYLLLPFWLSSRESEHGFDETKYECPKSSRIWE
jgi:hypothetical protein